MEVIIASIGSALISGVVTLIVSIITHNKSIALIEYQISELKKETQKHNSIIERTYVLESRADVLEEKLKVSNNRIKDLEGKVG